MWTIIRRILAVFFLVLIGLVMANCTMLGLNHASLNTGSKPGATPVLATASLAEWETQRAEYQHLLEAHVFGPYPEALPSRVVAHRVVDASYADGRGTLEEYEIEIGTGEDVIEFTLAVAFPNGETPAPLLVGQTFCGNQMTFSSTDLSPAYGPDTRDPCSGGGMMMSGVQMVFGEYIGKSPLPRILDRGYAYANFYAGAVVPDAGEEGRAVLDRFPISTRGRASGAVAAWGAGYGAALDVLEADPRIDAGRTAVYGHSRHAKSALVAGAYDARIDAVIAHQSGTGGAALNRLKVGESIERITKSYPHWFDPAYAKFDADGADTTPMDQHMLLALNAPHPILLGNGRRDVWSDPNGTYRAAEGADAAYEVYGLSGLDQSNMREINVHAEIVYYLRSGGHAINSEDWDMFLDFLDAALPVGEAP